MRIDMCAAMRMGMCMRMRIDVCADGCIGGGRTQMCMRKFMDVYIDMCMDMCIPSQKQSVHMPLKQARSHEVLQREASAEIKRLRGALRTADSPQERA